GESETVGAGRELGQEVGDGGADALAEIGVNAAAENVGVGGSGLLQRDQGGGAVLAEFGEAGFGFGELAAQFGGFGVGLAVEPVAEHEEALVGGPLVVRFCGAGFGGGVLKGQAG